MSNQPYKAIRFEWLAEDNPEVLVVPDKGNYERSFHALPEGLGTSSIETINLAMGMSIYHATNSVSPQAIGRSIPTAEISVDMKGPTFQAQVIHSGRVIEKQFVPVVDLILSPGIDLFRYSENYRILPMLDGSSNSEVTCLSIEQSMLELLLDKQEVRQILNHLNLYPLPKVVAAPIPRHVSAHLHAAISPTLTGVAKRLHCQARCLDYLTALLGQATPRIGIHQRTNKRSRNVHDILVNAHGKLPTLNDLAVEFGCSARTLNDEFSATYGVSIYAFVTNQRLMEAHDAILHTTQPLKVLAHKLGYAHVNHFITAFRKKFGYSPGSLRKK